MRKARTTKACIHISIALCLLSRPVCALDTVNYYGKYDVASKTPWRVATSLTGPTIEPWTIPTAKKPYKIGVLLPHVQNSYWLAVNQALITEAEKLQINLKIFSAGGYNKGGVQRKQLTNDVLNEKVDGVILASIFYDKLDRFIAQVDTLGTPIVAMINDVLSPNVKATVGLPAYATGEKLAEFVLDDAAGKNIDIAFFPGPKTAVWATDLYAGFLASIKQNAKGKPVGKIKIVAVQYDVLMADRQQQLVDLVLEAKPNINYIIANDLAATAASGLIADKYKTTQSDAKIIATYATADIYELVKAKKLYATVLDFNMDQARMALHLIVRYLNGEQANKTEHKFPVHSSPIVQLATSDDIDKYKPEQLFASKGFQATYELIK